MKHLIFSMPACPKCVEIKKYFEDKKIEFEEHSLADSEGVVLFRGFYSKLKDKIERNEDGSLPIPTILFLKGEEVVNIAHDLEKVKQIVENKTLV